MQKIELGIWKIFDCDAHRANGFASCFGINDATIYGFPILLNEKFKASRDRSDLTPMFQLKKNEAIVLLGKTPPPCLYWGFTPYLHKRKYENEDTYTTVNASLADTMNHQKFQDTLALSKPFLQPFMLIIGQNPRINEHIYQKDSFPQLERLGLADLRPFGRIVMPLPSDRLRDDDFITVLSRVTYIRPEYETAYKKRPGIFCFKVTVNLDSAFLGSGYAFGRGVAAADAQTPDPKSFFLLDRDDRIDEKKIVIGGSSTVQTVMDMYKSVALQKGLLPAPVNFFSVSLENPQIPIDAGFTCIDEKYDCFFDNRDTVYSVSRPIATTDAPNGIIICGVNHHSTKKAIYTNINIYDGDEFTPIFDLLLAPQKQPVFVKNGVIVRNNKFFYEIIVPVDFYRTHEKIFVAERAYLQSIVSASFSSVVPPQIYILPFTQANIDRTKCTQ
jgi:hypothetical protein